MRKMGWGCVDISTLMELMRLMSGKETRNKLIGKIEGELDIGMCQGDNKTRERESRMSWSSGAILSGVVREELTQKVVPAMRSEGGEGADTAGGSIPGRRNSRCKGPGAGGLLLCLRKIQ